MKEGYSEYWVACVGKKPKDGLDRLFSKKESLREELASFENNGDILNAEETREKLDTVMDDIASNCAERNRDKVNDYFKNDEDTMENSSQLKTWNLKKKLAPKNTIEPPSAKRNSQGELTTDLEELKELYLETYRDRLTPNDVPEYLEDVEHIFKIILKVICHFFH